MKKSLLFSFGILLAAGMIAGWAKPSDRRSDAETLLSESKSLFQGERKVTVRFCSFDEGAKTGGELLAQGQKVSEALGIPAAQSVEEKDGIPVYRTAGETAADASGTVSLLLTGSHDGASGYLIVKLETVSETQNMPVQWQRQTAQRLEKLGVRGTWNVMVQGGAAGAGDQPERFMKAAGAAFRAQKLETYSDEGTLSVSFATGMLKDHIRSGAHDVNLQAALHRDSITGQWRLTIGTPIITSEY
jgi:hypothetical protein